MDHAHLPSPLSLLTLMQHFSFSPPPPPPPPPPSFFLPASYLGGCLMDSPGFKELKNETEGEKEKTTSGGRPLAEGKPYLGTYDEEDDTERKTERQVKGREKKMLEARLWELNSQGARLIAVTLKLDHCLALVSRQG
ncbi:unnamed protein product [Pleuronectes platessa]|uniref:Uncharacterized protein n=1 Tax=Pleuronectes platessa TaxID=8262 RepID=A0A9N7THU9_PLEPL|nr:unnamed protein product [Pleuronectes platessa]